MLRCLSQNKPELCTSRLYLGHSWKGACHLVGPFPPLSSCLVVCPPCAERSFSYLPYSLDEVHSVPQNNTQFGGRDREQDFAWGVVQRIVAPSVDYHPNVSSVRGVTHMSHYCCCCRRGWPRVTQWLVVEAHVTHQPLPRLIARCL